MGTLGDRIGRRRLLLTGASAFAGLSLVVSVMRPAEPQPEEPAVTSAGSAVPEPVAA